jgi:heme exporter protein C
LILWLIYVSYVVLRRMIESPPQRASLSAVIGIIGFVDVPIVFMSIRIWRTIHPVLVSQKGMEMTVAMSIAMVVALIAFTLVYASLVWTRISLERRRVEVDAVKAYLGLY